LTNSLFSGFSISHGIFVGPVSISGLRQAPPSTPIVSA
jgi:hypothetical protein